jgi:hypothetical protein
MLADHLRHDSLAEAVSQTFDGKHLCPLCRAIAAAKKSEKKADAVSPTLKMEFPPTPAKPALFPPARFEFLPAHDVFADSLSYRPPLPPPRGFFA